MSPIDINRTFNPGLGIAERIESLVQSEVDDFRVDTDQKLAILDAFRAACCKPCEVTVNFSGGVRQKCWAGTRTDGDYRVVYLPREGYFSLCVESDFGPLDIGVHGSAIGCFSSV